MRPLRLLPLLCVLLHPSLALAEDKSVFVRVKEWFSDLWEDDPGARNTVTLNPLAVKHRRLGLEYERAFGTVMSVYLAPQVAYGRTGNLWRLSTELTLGTRFFVVGDAPSGIFFGPEVGGVYERARRADGFRRGYGLGLGANVGWSLVLFDTLVVSVGFAAQYRSVPDIDSPEPGLKVEFGAVPRFALGVAF